MGRETAGHRSYVTPSGRVTGQLGTKGAAVYSLGPVTVGLKSRLARVRPIAAVAAIAAIAAIVAAAACSAGSHNGVTAPVSPAVVAQRYQAAVDPANTAVNSVYKRALAYSGGTPSGLDALVSPTVAVLKKAASQLRAISAPQPVHGQILAVASSIDLVVSDLNALKGVRGSDVESDVTRLIADAGREAAADNVVRLQLATAENPPSSATTSAT